MVENSIIRSLIIKLLKDGMKRPWTDEVHGALADRFLLEYYLVTPDFKKMKSCTCQNSVFDRLIHRNRLNSRTRWQDQRTKTSHLDIVSFFADITE